jgi:5-methylthioadenosine/S-adenosylhomocysteine deaminase
VTNIQVDHLIRNAYIVTMDPDRKVFTNGYIAILNDKIIGIGPDNECEYTSKKIVNGKGKAVLPGLINAHNHINQILLKSSIDDSSEYEPNITGFMQKMVDIWSNATPELCYKIVRLHLMEMMLSGITAVHDQHFTNFPNTNIDGTLQAIKESNLRAFVSRCHLSADSLPEKAREKVGDVLKEIQRLQSIWTSDLITITGSPINPTWVKTPEELIELREGIRSLGVPFDIDLSGASWKQTLLERGYTKGGAVQYCAELGILDSEVSGGKSFMLEPNEYDIWKETGMTACIVPLGRIRDELGPSTHHFLARGILPALGNDGPMGTPKSSMWQVMRHTYIADIVRKKAEAAQNYTEDHDIQITPEIILEMATLGGQKHLFLDPSVGGLEVGKSADFIIVDISSHKFYPHNDFRRTPTHLVFATDANDVEFVMVKGNILVENKQCKIWNYDEVKEDAEIAAKILLKEAGYEKMLPTRMPGSSFHNWQYI